MDGIAIMTRVYQMGALVEVLDRPYLDLTTPIGKGILALLSALAGGVAWLRPRTSHSAGTSPSTPSNAPRP